MYVFLKMPSIQKKRSNLEKNLDEVLMGFSKIGEEFTVGKGFSMSCDHDGRLLIWTRSTPFALEPVVT